MQTTTAGTIRLARTAGIPEGTGRECKVGERYIAVFCSEGHFYAIEDECPHAGAPLNDGTVHKGIVTCLRHGWRFDLREGRNWLQVLGTTETPQIDQGVGYQFHPVVALLDGLEPEEQPLEFVLPRKRPLDALP